MQVRLLHLVTLFGVAGEACVHRIGLNESRSRTRMWIMAGRAIALRSGMLHFGFFNLLGLLAMAGDANCFWFGLGEDDLAVLCRQVAGIAGSGFEGGMGEFLHQVGLRRLERLVALDTVGSGERLSLMGLHQVGRSRVVAVKTERRRGLGEVIVKLLLALLAGLVGSVAGLATHIEGGVTASLFRDVQSLGVTIKTEILAFVARCGLQQLVFVVGLVRAVTLDAIADGRWMNGSLNGGRVHVCMT